MTFDVRDNDKGFQPGDKVTYQEWDPDTINATTTSPKGYTGSPDLKFEVGYVYVLSSDRVIFSLLPIKKSKAR